MTPACRVRNCGLTGISNAARREIGRPGGVARPSIRAAVARAEIPGALGFRKIVAIKMLDPRVNSNKKFIRALINEVAPSERIVTIEDAYELGIDRFHDLHPDHDALQSRPANIEGHGEITLADLTRMALRMDPDRVIVGEVRGAEAFTMLLAMSQGNNGSMCTMHADSARSVFPKLAAYVSMASTGLPVETINTLIASALHFVVHIELIDGVRRIKSILEVVDAEGPTITSNEVFSWSGQGRSRSYSSMRQASRLLLLDHGFEAVGGAA